MSAENETDDRTIFCQVCKSEVTLEHCDDCGACPGNIFCGKCCHEIDMDGKPTLLCGDCDECRNLVAIGLFEEGQKLRKNMHLQSVVVA